jgi:hypothetical protein
VLADRLWVSLTRLDRVDESASAFGDGPALWANGTEIAHRDDEQVFDVRLTRNLIRARRTELRADPRVQLRRSSAADWIEVTVRGPADEQFLRAIVQQAAEAHQPLPGTTSRPPPTDKELERRRRFH